MLLAVPTLKETITATEIIISLEGYIIENKILCFIWNVMEWMDGIEYIIFEILT